MYVDDIKIFTKTKITGDPDTNNKNIHAEYGNGIWYWKMCNADYEKK